jgi:hypothetical protein
MTSEKLWLGLHVFRLSCVTQSLLLDCVHREYDVAEAPVSLRKAPLATSGRMRSVAARNMMCPSGATAYNALISPSH